MDLFQDYQETISSFPANSYFAKAGFVSCDNDDAVIENVLITGINPSVPVNGQYIPTSSYPKPFNGDESKEYLIDYYFQYGKEALIYLIKKERFNGTFLLEGKFYTKDENDGLNSTNILTMPKVRVVSDINLRLGERADPTVSVFNIVAMPDRAEDSENLLMKIVRLDEDIDADI